MTIACALSPVYPTSCQQTTGNGLGGPVVTGAQRRNLLMADTHNLRTPSVTKPAFLCAARARSFNGRAVREGLAPAGSCSPVRQPARFRSPSWRGVAVLKSLLQEPIMANQRLRESASNYSEAPARRRLAPNVTCMFPEDRPPVVNRPRRGRYPNNVVRILSSGPRFYPGVVCELRTALDPDGVPVIVVGSSDDRGWFYIKALGGHKITFGNGDTGVFGSAHPGSLFRSAIVSVRYAKEARHV